MDERIETVRQYYDQNAVAEWDRLDAHPFEFVLTTHMMEKYVKPGDSVLDIGGGPGRYAIHFAKMGCDVTLVDLSEGNIALAGQKAAEEGASLQAYAANCLELESLALGQFDHVFLMGPLYHLLDESQRVSAVELALSHLKPGGVLYCSFILEFAAVIYDLKNAGSLEQDFENPDSDELLFAMERGENYTGATFTDACFFHQNNILPFMERFGLTKLHLFGQEGFLALNEKELLARTQSELDCWISLAKRFIEQPELLALSEHAMYIGQKRK